MDYLLKNWLAAVLISMGLFVVLTGFKNHHRQQSYTSWNSTEGVVVRSSMIIKQRTRKHNRLGKRQTIHRAKVEFNYEVDGTKLLHSQSHFNGQSPAKVVKKYTAGTKVVVFYNPEDINDSILEPETGSNLSGLLFVGSVFFLVGTAMVVAPLLNRRR